MKAIAQRRSWALDNVGPRATRLILNLWPALRGTGVRVKYVAADWTELRIELPHSWRTRNVVGTIFGGSIYAAADPFLLLLVMRRLGPEYITWVKSGAVRFRQPARTMLHATFTFSASDELELRRTLDVHGVAERVRNVDMTDREGNVLASITTTLHVSKFLDPSKRFEAKGRSRRTG